RRTEAEVLLDGADAKLALDTLKDGTLKLVLLTLDVIRVLKIEELLLNEEDMTAMGKVGVTLDRILDDGKLPEMLDVLDNGKSLDDDKMFDNGNSIDVDGKLDAGTMLDDGKTFDVDRMLEMLTLDDCKVLEVGKLSKDGEIDDGKMFDDGKSIEVDNELDDGTTLEDDIMLDDSKMFGVDRTLEMPDDCRMLDDDGMSGASRLELGKMLNPDRMLDDCKMLEDGNALDMERAAGKEAAIKPFVEEDAAPVLILIVSTVPEEAASNAESLEMAKAAAGELCRLIDDEGVDVVS
ncbi:hypothetical protein KCU73_g16190, partial [Aureobasidium melanogenum]